MKRGRNISTGALGTPYFAKKTGKNKTKTR
jgi:hypothetical protein